ncbi:MAG: hypothetical protein H7Y04_16365 [Verrucomicrobia bacterium]|nr:hypothetical protein [Cytophagales bacterium]
MKINFIKSKIYLYTIGAVLIVNFVSCKKDSGNTPAQITSSKCIIQSETYGLAANEKSFGYEYDTKGNLVNVKVFRPNGSESASYAIGSNIVVFRYTFGSKPASDELKYNVSDLTLELPSEATTTLVNEFDATVQVNYDFYFFYYDAKNQLIQVSQRKGSRKGGNEYDLKIFYNDKGNVTGLKYSWFTGPNEDIPGVIVTDYDDKPNPHASIKAWKFFLINNNWQNNDPGPIIAALSQNNPLGFSVGAGQNLFERKIVYEYNSDGFPTTQKNTNKNASGEYTFYQTFTYVCR